MAHHTEKSVFPDAPHQPSLSQAINASTKDLHDTVNMEVMARFDKVMKLNDYRLYREGIISFYHVYAAFERTWAGLVSPSASLPRHIETVLTAIADPRLTRAPVLASDLTYLYNTEFDTSATPARPELAAYVRHIENQLREKPHTAVAYAHSYYMALFAGGKILRKMVKQKKDFFPVYAPAGSHDEAVQLAMGMFEFPVLADQQETLRTRFKDAMAFVEEQLNEEEKTDIIEEARACFKWNERLVKELDIICAPLYPAAKMRQATSLIRRADAYKLPFAILLIFLFYTITRAFRAGQ